ncbi:MAG: glycoside hydrolase family 5 protein [Candidatus Bathyarchaeia archaeon]
MERNECDVSGSPLRVPHSRKLVVALVLVILAGSALIYSLQSFSGRNAGTMNSVTVSTVSNLTEPGLTLLSVNGTQIVDRDGNIVVLRGVNLSGYEYSPPEWIHNESDFKTIASWGFNVIRLPISWENIEPRPGHYNEDYLRLIDQDIAWAKAYGIYVVLDMHEICWSSQFASCNKGYSSGIPRWAVAIYQDSVPGIQLMLHDFYLGLGPNGTAPSPTNPSIEARFYAVWKYVAARYFNETNIAAYDVLNEPIQQDASLADNATFTSQVLPAFYTHAISAIRTVDPNHICLWEGPTIVPIHLPNLIYSPHYPQGSSSVYDPGKFGQEINVLLDLSTRWNVPLFVGEWGMYANASGIKEYISDSLTVYDYESISSTWWDYARGNYPMDLFDTHGSPRQILVQNIVRPFVRAASTEFHTITSLNSTNGVYDQSIQFQNENFSKPQRIVLISVPEGYSASLQSNGPEKEKLETQFFVQSRTLMISVSSSVSQINLEYIPS